MSPAGDQGLRPPVETAEGVSEASTERSIETPTGDGGTAIGKPTVAFAAADAAVKLLAMGVVLWLSHVLSQVEFGTYGLTIAIANLLAVVFTFGLHASAGRWYFDRETDKFRRLVFTILVSNAVMTIGLAFLLDLFGERLFDALFTELRYVPYGRLAVVIGVAMTLTNLPLAVLISQRRTTRVVALTIAVTLFPMLGVVLGALSTGDLAGVVWGYAGGAMLVGLLSFSLALSMARPGFEWGELRGALAYGLPLVPHLVAHWLLSLSDRYLLEHFHGVAAVAPYHLAYLFGQAVSMLGVAVNKAWYPLYTRQMTEIDRLAQEEGSTFDSRPGPARPPKEGAIAEQWAAVRRKARSVAGLLFAAGTGVAIWGEELLRPLVPDGYESSPAMILPIVLGTTALTFYYLPVYGLFYRRRNGWIPVATLLAAAVNVGLNVILIPRWGGIGAALATLIAYIALLVLVTLVSRRYCRQTLTRREVLELVGLALLLVPVALAAVLDASWAVRLPLKLVVNALILAGLWWRGYLTEGLAQVAAVLARLRPGR